ncbi:MAG: hypothetical protein KAJ20_01960, partial [Candidatus Aenigmarchaeota archaeon]|nr:hypothetical protein [Candidatus Aenigmarchaeota archaeon]
IDVVDLGSGNYSCEWNTTDTGVGRYDVIAKAYNISYYNNGTFTEVDSFRVIPPINDAPNLTNRTILQDIDGWSATFNFSVEVYDKNYDTVNVSFWISSDNSTWVFEDSQNCTACNDWNQLNFSYEGFSCSDQQVWYYKFNATDYINDTELSSGNFTVERSNVTVVYNVGGGNATSANRTSPGSTQFLLQIYDSDNVSSPQLSAGYNASFWVSYNDTDYDNGYITQTNSTGYINYTFKPSCVPIYSVGPQNWTGGIKGDSCYFDTNITEQLIVYIIGEMNITFISPSGEKYLRGEENVTIRANITSECSVQETLNTTIVNFTMTSQYTSTPYACTSEIYNESTGYYNCTFDTSGKDPRGYNITMNATQQYYLTSITTEVYSPATESFWIETRPTLVAPDVTPSSGGWGENHYFTVNATDYDLDTLIVKAWFREDSEIYTTINSRTNNTISGVDQYVTFSPKTFTNAYADTTWYYKFNVTASDGDGYINETVENSFYLEPDNVSIEYIYGNNSIVNRSAQTSDPDYNITLITRAWDIDKDPDAYIMFKRSKFYLTNDTFSNYIPYPFLPTSYINSNVTGYQTYTFKPDCTYAVGPQKWKSGLLDNLDYYSANSTEFYFNITTTPLVAILDYPTGNLTFEKGVDNILLRGNVTDDCGLVSDANVDIRVVQGGSDYAICYPAGDETDGWYNCTIANTTHNAWPVGWYNVTIKADKQYYNDSNTFIVENAF